MVVTRDRVAVDVPAITGVDAAVFTVPTDAPEADGTLARDATIMVLVTAPAGNERGIGWTYGPAAARWVVADQLAPVAVGRSASASWRLTKRTCPRTHGHGGVTDHRIRGGGDAGTLCAAWADV